jgi:hypothetical protein
MVGLMIAGFSITAVGGPVPLAAWIGTLVNTYRLDDKTWFAVVLAGGRVGWPSACSGFAAMFGYLIAGPDAMAVRQLPAPASARRPSTFAPTT